MGWLSRPVIALRGAWAHAADDRGSKFSSSPATRDLPRWDTTAFRQTLQDFKREARIPRDALEQLQAISQVILQPKQPTPFEAGSAAWAAHEQSSPGTTQTADSEDAHDESYGPLVPTHAWNHRQQTLPASTLSQLRNHSSGADSTHDPALHAVQPFSRVPSHSSNPSPQSVRSRSSSDLQHGSLTREEFAEGLRGARQQTVEAHQELQRLREDRDQLRVALDSALSQSQQLGALQSEVTMLKGQLEETRQLTMHSMTRTQSTLSLPYDQVEVDEDMGDQPGNGSISRRHSTSADSLPAPQHAPTRGALHRRHSMDILSIEQHRTASMAPDLAPLVESPVRTPPENVSVGQLSFAEAQALLFRLDSALPVLNGSGCSLTSRAEHAAELADRLAKADAELKALRFKDNDLGTSSSQQQSGLEQQSSAPSEATSRSASIPNGGGRSHDAPDSQGPSYDCQPSDMQQHTKGLRLAAISMQARIDALEYQLASEQGKSSWASQECNRLEGELEILRSVKSDRMGIQGRLASMADTLAGTHKDLVGAMQQRNALQSLLKHILQAAGRLSSTVEDSRASMPPTLTQRLKVLQGACGDAQELLQSMQYANEGPAGHV